MSGTKSAASKVLHFKALYQDMELERIKYFRGKHKAKSIEIKKRWKRNILRCSSYLGTSKEFHGCSGGVCLKESDSILYICIMFQQDIE